MGGRPSAWRSLRCRDCRLRSTRSSEPASVDRLQLPADGHTSGHKNDPARQTHSKIPGEMMMKMRTLAALTAMALAAMLAACGQQSQTTQQAADKAKESASKAAD